MEKKKGFQMPHTYIIIFGVILFAALLTVFIPLGKYDTKEITYMQNGVEKTRTVLDPESFQYILDENGNKVTKAAPIFGTEDFGGQGILNYVFEGMTVGDKNGTAVGIIAFILVVGGAFGIVLRTGAIESGIMRVIALTNGREILLIPILVVLFSLGGAVFGMGEEAIPFVMILVPMFIAMGYDAVVGIMCSYVSTQIGFGSSWQNPFGLAVAQGVAGIPVMSGAWFRIPLWIFFTGLTIVFTMRYAVKIKKDPQLSVAYESDEEYRKEFAKNGKEMPPFTLGHKLVLLTVAACMVWTIWGVVSEGYYIPEIASQFFVMGLVSGIIGVVLSLFYLPVSLLIGGNYPAGLICGAGGIVLALMARNADPSPRKTLPPKAIAGILLSGFAIMLTFFFFSQLIQFYDLLRDPVKGPQINQFLYQFQQRLMEQLQQAQPPVH